MQPRSTISVNDRGKVLVSDYESFIEIEIRNGERNVADVEVLQDLIVALQSFTRNTEYLIIHGNERYFSVGFDSSCSRIKEPDFLKDVQQYAFILRRMIESFPGPVYSFVDGYALGLGFELVLSSDIILASENAKFGFPDTLYGMPPLMVSLDRIREDYGKSIVNLFMTGEIISMDDSRSGLFVSRINVSGSLENLHGIIKDHNRTLHSYYKQTRTVGANNPEMFLLDAIDTDKIRIRELEAFRNTL